MLTLRGTFAAAGVRPSAAGVSFPNGLETTWHLGGLISVRQNLERMLFDPKIGSWAVSDEHPVSDRVWTEHCQGVACDGSFWYISHDNGGEDRGIHKFEVEDIRFERERASFRPGSSLGTHLGDIDVGMYKGRECLFAAYEETPKNIGQIVVLDRDLKVEEVAYLKAEDGVCPPPTGPKAPWCAYNYGNGLLYTSSDLGIDCLHAFDPERDFRHVPSESIQLDRFIGRKTLTTWGSATEGLPDILKVDGKNSVQGAAFNLSGQVFISQALTPEILAFSTYTGALLGSIPFEMHPDLGDVAEGLCWAPLLIDGVPCGLHFVLLDWDIGAGKDDIFLKHVATGSVP